MLSAHAKELIAKLGLELCPVAVKFCPNIPEGFERNEDELMLCQFVKNVMVTKRSYYIDVAEKPCLGKCVLGIEKFNGATPAGLIGWECGMFKTAAGNAHLYHEIKTLYPGACNYVAFSPVEDCTFDPDMIIFVAPTDEAFNIMRATSWVTGDPWESKFTQVLSCAWMFPYPYVTGKVNFLPTNMQYGQRMAKSFESGQLIICVPYQKIDEMIKGLDEMDWTLLGLRGTEEATATEHKILEKIDAMELDKTLEYDICEKMYDTSE